MRPKAAFRLYGLEETYSIYCGRREMGNTIKHSHLITGDNVTFDVFWSLDGLQFRGRENLICKDSPTIIIFLA